jgi:hypothetical protein
MNVFSRVLKGIQALFDTLEAKGEEYNSEDNNSVKNQVKSQGRLIHKFSNNLDKLESEFENTKTDMSSKIEQNEKEIKTTVKKGDVSSEISQEANSVTLKGNRLIIESDDFQLTKDGHIVINTANLKLDEDGNATFSGTINGSTINGSTFKNKSITIDGSSAVFNYSNNKLEVLPNKMLITIGNYNSVYTENEIILGGRDTSGTTGLVLSCDGSTTGHIDINGPLYINATGGVYANGNRIG